jgi:hypothetical protein
MAISVSACALAMAAIGPPIAGADVEPNSSIFEPEGPALQAGPFDGTLSAADDRDDWYVVYVDGVHQLHLNGGLDDPGCGTLRLTDRDGTPIASDFTSSPGLHRYFVRASLSPFGPCADTGYSFTIDPAGAFVEGPGKLPFLGTQEPNDTRADAGGPLGPNAWYFSGLETINDQDWMRLYTRGGRHRIELEIATYGSTCFGQRVSIVSHRGRALANVFPAAHGTDTITRLSYRSRRAQRLYVHVVGSGAQECVGAKTVLQVGPADSVASASEVRSACRAARRSERRLSRRVAAMRRTLVRAGKPAPRALTRRLAHGKRKLREVRRLVGVYCA